LYSLRFLTALAVIFTVSVAAFFILIALRINEIVAFIQRLTGQDPSGKMGREDNGRREEDGDVAISQSVEPRPQGWSAARHPLDYIRNRGKSKTQASPA
jgi:hypothetical protein